MAAHVLILFYVIFMGAWTACFIGCAAYRLPRGQPLDGRSHCENCHATLSWDIAPVIGWLLLRGKCRFCKTPVPGIYPAVEALLALVFLGEYLLWHLSLKWLMAAAASSLLLYVVLCTAYFSCPATKKGSHWLPFFLSS